MKTSYLKVHLFGKCYPKWMPNLHSDCGQDSNLCTRGSQDPKVQAVPLYHSSPLSLCLVWKESRHKKNTRLKAAADNVHYYICTTFLEGQAWILL